MKLTTFLVSAVLALGVAAVNPEAGNDVEARDFSGESLNEFDARDEDLEERTYTYNPCKGKNVEYKLVNYKKECVCTRSGEYYNKWNGCQCKDGYEYSDTYSKCIKKCKDYEVYNPKGYCEKPFTCVGDHVKVEIGDYGKKYCKCELTGQYYNDKTGCACKTGYEYSETYKKCIPTCEYGYEYNSKTDKCEKPFSCKGDHVKVEIGDYGKKYCKCELTGQYYNDKTGCECKWGKEYSETYKKCIPKCEYGYEYNSKTDKCEKPFSCKGDHVKIEIGDYGKKYCKCELTGQYYNDKTGCECKWGKEYSETYKKCIPKCEYGYEYNPKSDKCEKPFTCKGKNVEVAIGDYDKKYCKCTLPNQEYNEHKGCVCKDGYEYSWHYKQCIPKCSYGTEYNGHECAPVCKGDYVVFKHKECKCLKKGYVYDKTTGCVDRCPRDNDYWNGHKCVCKWGFVEYKGKCVAPPTCKGYGSYFDKSKWECRCTKRDEKYVEHKGCVKKCPDHSSWNGWKCECDYGYVDHKGQCVKVPTCKGYGSYFDKSKWQCRCEKKDYEYTKNGCQKKSYGGY